jgi:deoxycytidylate deaminase
MNLKFTGSFDDLKNKLTSIEGEWDDSQPNKKVLRKNEGVMNWFESTGTINFQGKGGGKTELESSVPNLLYPKETPKIITSTPTPVETVPPEDGNQGKSLEYQYLTSGLNNSELVIGVVSAVGTEYKQVTKTLKNRLERFGYHVEEIRVSTLLGNLSTVAGNSEYERIKFYMEKGDALREKSKTNDILAAGVARTISQRRQKIDSEEKKIAYIVNSLKHPKEVEFLRKVYSNGFYLIGIHADEKSRHKYLTEDKNCTQDQANELIKIDENESVDHGQKTRDTYHLSDFFINLGSNTNHVKNNLQRFLELIFSHPYKNPTFDEFAMFMAFNSSARSSDLSRQVGAIITREKQIIATGANDVPKSGGGQYWAEVNPSTGEISDIPDGKDYTREGDSNKQTQNEMINEIANSLLKSELIASDKKNEIEQILKESKISDLTEFGRVVHAEMDALLSCNRAGIPTVGTTLYCTTFPCHNCAKHIIASGVKRVVYVEPYPKSRALDFHSESIKLQTEFDKRGQGDQADQSDKLVIFEPFIGVGPRRFLDLFSMNLGSGSKLRRKDKNGETVDWKQETAPIRTPLLAKSYLEIENEAKRIWSVNVSTNSNE